MKIRRKQDKSILGGIIIPLFLIVITSYAQNETMPPECINLSEVRKMIVYPDSAKENGIVGRVVVKLLIGLDGNVIKSGNITGPAVFYNEIRRICMYLKFTPAIYNGKKVKCWVSVPFNFKIKPDDDEEK